MILTVTLNPCVDTCLFVDGLRPHDTNRVTRTEQDAGGKGLNVSRVLAELEVPTLATGFLGGPAANTIFGVLDRQGVRHQFVPIAGATRSNFSVEDGSGNPPTTFNSPGPATSRAEFEALRAVVTSAAASANWVVFAGSLPPDVTPHDMIALAEEARSSGARVVIDADGMAMVSALAFGPDLVKPNVSEARRLLGADWKEDVVASAKLLNRRQSAGGAIDPITIISDGGEGATLVAGGQAWFAPAIDVPARSTIGSGDSMVAGFLAGLVQGQTPDRAICLGSACGAATATTDGTEIGRRSEIESLLPKAVAEPRP